jgi:hypothetical protein
MSLDSGQGLYLVVFRQDSSIFNTMPDSAYHTLSLIQEHPGVMQVALRATPTITASIPT